MAGNYYPWRIQWGQMDAGYGWLLEPDGKGNFKAVYPRQSGFWAPGDVRGMVRIQRKGIPAWMMGRHNGSVLGYRLWRGY
jgi:hypothetical protein